MEQVAERVVARRGVLLSELLLACVNVYRYRHSILGRFCTTPMAAIGRADEVTCNGVRASTREGQDVQTRVYGNKIR